jgi:transposase
MMAVEDQQMSDDEGCLPPGNKRPYFRPTTADQRRLMFAVYEQTDSPCQACESAHVCLGTFYRWRPRFLVGGYAALDEPGSHRPHASPNQLPNRLVEEVITAKREHPTWGKRRIADELAKGHGWQAVISASQVRRVLLKAGLWPQRARPTKKGDPPSAMPKNLTRR